MIFQRQYTDYSVPEILEVLSSQAPPFIMSITFNSYGILSFYKIDWDATRHVTRIRSQKWLNVDQKRNHKSYQKKDPKKWLKLEPKKSSLHTRPITTCWIADYCLVHGSTCVCNAFSCAESLIFSMNPLPLPEIVSKICISKSFVVMALLTHQMYIWHFDHDRSTLH